MEMSMSEMSPSELLRGQAQLWNHTFSFITSSVVRCAVELGISDVLYKHGKPMRLSDLSAQLPTLHPSKISFIPILMRFLVHSGFLKQHEDSFSLTPVSRLLVKNEPLNVRSLLHVNQEPFFPQKTWSELSNWFQNDLPTAFHTAHDGKSFWEYVGENPKLENDFNDVMASDSRLISNVLMRDYKHVFEGLTSLVDVGGGTGTMATAIAEAFPNIKCTVLDLPRVISQLKGSGNLEFVGGSMFEEIPHANAILLKWVLHDWNDEDCVKVLKKCKEAIPNREKGGKVIIIEMVMEDSNNKESHDEFVETQHLLDMSMMALHAAKERTEKEWEKLFTEAGFILYKITPTLGFRSLIEIYS